MNHLGRSPRWRVYGLAIPFVLSLIASFSGLLTATTAEAQTRRAAFDFTGDGSSDVLFRRGTTIGAWDYDAAGVAAPYIIGDVDTEWSIVGAGDYNGDGTADLLFRHSRTGATGYWAVRNGALSSFVPLIWDTSPRWHVVGSRKRTDFNGDGRDDILWRHDSGQLGIYTMTGSGPFQFTWTVIGTYSRDWTVVGTGDFDGDGRDDVLWRHNSSGAVRYMTLGPAGVTWVDLGVRDLSWYLVAIGDFDDDRCDDIYWTNFGSQNATEGFWDINNGVVAGFVTPGQPVALGFAARIGAAGDYRGDGSEDLMQINSSFPPHFGIVSARRYDMVNGQVTGSSDSMVYDFNWQMLGELQAGQLGPAPTSRHTAYDFLEDGTSDLLLRNADGTIAFWNNATGSPRTILGTADPSWDVIGVGDYNGDRNSDILFRHQGDGAIGYWKIYRGAVAGWVPLTTSFGTDWQVVSSRRHADFDGDGRDDILLRKADGTLAMLLITGATSTSVQPVDLGASDPTWTVEGTADLTGDGRDDILFHHAASGSYGYVRMAASGMQAWTGLVSGLDANWFVGALGDFNGDGFDDIYWRTSTTLPEGYWNMANGALTAFVPNVSVGKFPDATTSGFLSGDYNGDGYDDVLAAYADGSDTRYTILPFVNGASAALVNIGLLQGWTVQ